jgi:hypothetical protein
MLIKMANASWTKELNITTLVCVEGEKEADTLEDTFVRSCFLH